MDHRSLRVAPVLVALVLAASGGCAGIEKQNRAGQLDRAVHLYVDSIRWGNFDIAASFIRRRGDETPSATVNIPAEVRVTAYASSILSLNEGRNEATVATSFDYYFPNTSTVRTVSQTDLWWFDPAAERWYLHGGLPDFKP